MMDVSEDEIRTRAYELWESAGSPEGSAESFWHAAEEELAERAKKERSRETAETSSLVFLGSLVVH